MHYALSKLVGFVMCRLTCCKAYQIGEFIDMLKIHYQDLSTYALGTCKLVNGELNPLKYDLGMPKSDTADQPSRARGLL